MRKACAAASRRPWPISPRRASYRGLPSCSSARIRRASSCPQQGSPDARNRHALLRAPAPRLDLAGGSARAGRDAQRRSGGGRHPRAIAVAVADRRARRDRGDRSRQGCRRLPSHQCGPARHRQPERGNGRAGALHAARQPDARPLGAAGSVGAGGGGGRPLHHRRQADGAIAPRARIAPSPSRTRARATFHRSAAAPIFWWLPSAGPR